MLNKENVKSVLFHHIELFLISYSLLPVPFIMSGALHTWFMLFLPFEIWERTFFFFFLPWHAYGSRPVNNPHRYHQRREMRLQAYTFRAFAILVTSHETRAMELSYQRSREMSESVSLKRKRIIAHVHCRSSFSPGLSWSTVGPAERHQSYKLEC